MNWKKKEYFLRNGFLILWSYLCISSNLLSCGILVAYIGVRLLIGIYSYIVLFFAKESNKRRVIREFVTKYGYELFVLLYWFICAVMESTGDRAAQGDKQIKIKESVQAFLGAIYAEKKLLLISAIVIILSLIFFAVSIFRSLVSKRNLNLKQDIFFNHFVKFTACAFISVIYTILLCSVVDFSYLYRTDVMITWNVYLMVLLIYSLGYIMEKFSKSIIIVPLLSYILIFETIVSSHVFTVRYYDKYVLKTWNDYVVEQIVNADRNGVTEIDLRVPQFDSYDGWPIANYGGDRISYSLYSLGIISDPITIHLIPDESVNKEFNFK